MRQAPKGEPELLKLLNQRAAWNLPEYKVPQHDPQRVRDAVSQYARAHNTDPFAARRMALYLANGYELPSDILADSNRQLQQRQQRKKGNGNGPGV